MFQEKKKDDSGTQYVLDKVFTRNYNEIIQAMLYEFDNYMTKEMDELNVICKYLKDVLMSLKRNDSNFKFDEENRDVTFEEVSLKHFLGHKLKPKFHFLFDLKIFIRFIIDNYFANSVISSSVALAVLLLLNELMENNLIKDFRSLNVICLLKCIKIANDDQLKLTVHLK